MEENKKCGLCGTKMVKLERKKIGDTDYDILKCGKCNHTVAKSVE